MTVPAPWRRPPRLQVVVTCEHASNAVPRDLHGLGLPASVLRSHRGWDPGALPIARSLAKVLAAPLHVGPWSRLVVDLNRSDDHPRVIARRVDGRTVPGNVLSAAARQDRIDWHWRPWRDAVVRDIESAAARGLVLHLSVHSFVEKLGGVERKNDVGLLHDPRRPQELAFCEALRRPLAAAGLVVRRNFPYFGHTDGFTSWLRSRWPANRYLGIEIECNQRLSRTVPGQRRLLRALGDALRTLTAVP